MGEECRVKMCNEDKEGGFEKRLQKKKKKRIREEGGFLTSGSQAGRPGIWRGAKELAGTRVHDCEKLGSGKGEKAVEFVAISRMLHDLWEMWETRGIGFEQLTVA